MENNARSMRIGCTVTAAFVRTCSL